MLQFWICSKSKTLVCAAVVSNRSLRAWCWAASAGCVQEQLNALRWLLWGKMWMKELANLQMPMNSWGGRRGSTSGLHLLLNDSDRQIYCTWCNRPLKIAKKMLLKCFYSHQRCARRNTGFPFHFHPASLSRCGGRLGSNVVERCKVPCVSLGWLHRRGWVVDDRVVIWRWAVAFQVWIHGKENRVFQREVHGVLFYLHCWLVLDSLTLMIR